MADKTKTYRDNVPGKFYVDQECIACDACVNLAPEFFEMHEKGYAFVRKQPETAGQFALCKEAGQGCPVEAIGSEGE